MLLIYGNKSKIIQIQSLSLRSMYACGLLGRFGRQAFLFRRHCNLFRKSDTSMLPVSTKVLRILPKKREKMKPVYYSNQQIRASLTSEDVLLFLLFDLSSSSSSSCTLLCELEGKKDYGYMRSLGKIT